MIRCNERMWPLACCGLYELTNFGSTGESTLEAYVLSLGSRYGLIASTVATQCATNKELPKHGFEPITSFINPNSRHKVTVWFRKPGGK